MKVKVKCIRNYNDLQLNKDIKIGDEFIVDKDRADQLTKANVAEIIEVIKEEKKIEKATKPKKKTEKATKKNK